MASKTSKSRDSRKKRQDREHQRDNSDNGQFISVHIHLLSLPSLPITSPQFYSQTICW